jgi:hypothetical protein
VARQPVPRNVPRRVGRAKALVAVRTRDHAPPEAIEAARAELAEANAEAAIRRIVDTWPPLSPAQRERLALLLNPGAGSDAT